MTLVQASIAGRGEAVVLTSDRLLTRYIGDLPPYEFESISPKIIALGNKIAMGFAGSELYANKISSYIMDRFERQKISSFDDVVKEVSEYIKKLREDEIAKEIWRRCGIKNYEDFFTNPNLPIPEEVRGTIYIMMAERDSPIVNCEALVAGFDEESNARICVVGYTGDIFDLTDSGMAAIGSGAPFSIIYHDQYGYSPNMSIEEALIFSFEAKKWAEAPRGVSRKTDMILIRKVKKEKENRYDFILREFYDGCELLKKLEQYYNKKRKILAKSQKELIKHISSMLL